MISGIRKWFRKRRFIDVSNRILTAEKFDDTMKDFIEWSELVLEFISEERLYSKRVKVPFKNIAELTTALDYTCHNLINAGAKSHRTGDYNMLIDDWLVDDESYRITLKEFLERNKDRFRTIKTGLENCNASGLAYHLSGSYDMFIALRKIVEICHE